MSLEVGKEVRSRVEGEIPCLVIFSDRKHVEYIYNIVNCIEECLSQKGFKIYLLSDDTSPDEHFGRKFEDLAKECVLGVIILDGFRPNILYEYGFLRGLNKIIILLQDKKATVAVKSFYTLPRSPTEAVVKDIVGLTKAKLKHLKEPPIGHFYHLSNRHGIKTIEVDCAARLDSPDHPSKKLEDELQKLRPKITEKYSEQSLEPLRDIDPDYFKKFHSIALKISEYYGGVAEFDVKDIEGLIDKVKKLEENSGVKMPSRMYSTIASLYTELAENTKWEHIQEIVTYYSKAVEIHKMILDFEADPISKGNSLVKIGEIHNKISKYQNRAKNCKEAIKALKEALKIFAYEKFPNNYAMTQGNLGVAFGRLADIEETVENCKKAVEAFREILKVYTYEKFPISYAMTQNNLGLALGTLAEEEDKVKNCKEAIKAFKEALKVYSHKKTPDYALVQNNLGLTLGTLAEEEDRVKNCKEAIKALKEALKVRTLERNPIGYAMSQNNLGNALSTLAEEEDKVKNCKEAIKAFKGALKVYTYEKFPFDYAGTQNNLGNALGVLAGEEDKVKNCKEAIKAFKEALKVYTKEEYPKSHHSVEDNLRQLLNFCKSK